MKCFLAFLRQQLRSITFYRFEFFSKILYSCIAMYGARCLWITLHAQNPALLQRSLPDMITYATLAMALDMIFYPAGDNTVHTYMNEQIRKGNIDIDLLRPMGFQRQMFYRNASRMLSLALFLVLPACVLAQLFMGQQLPATSLHALAFVPSIILAYFVLFSLNFLLGLLCIVTYNIKQIAWAYRSLICLLSGQLVPLWLFPDGVQNLFNLLPFRCIFDIPLNVYTGAIGANRLPSILLFQLVWACGLLLTGQWLWRLTRKRITIQGG